MSGSKNLNIEHYCKVKSKIIKLGIETYKECPYGCGWTLKEHNDKVKKEHMEKEKLLGKKIVVPETSDVHYRKLQLIGGSTFNISIPHDFIAKLNLSPGDIGKIILTEKGITIQFYEDEVKN